MNYSKGEGRFQESGPAPERMSRSLTKSAVEPRRESRLEDINRNQNDNVSRLWNIVSRMGQLADRVLGAIPETATNSKDPVEPSAMIDKVAVGVHVEESIISRLEDEVSRLEVL